MQRLPFLLNIKEYKKDFEIKRITHHHFRQLTQTNDLFCFALSIVKAFIVYTRFFIRAQLIRT